MSKERNPRLKSDPLAWVKDTDTLKDSDKEIQGLEDKSLNPQVTISPKRHRVTFYLPPEMIKQIKHRAIEEGKDISQLAREVFSQFLHLQSD